jgi:hypothetical protein
MIACNAIPGLSLLLDAILQGGDVQRRGVPALLSRP